MDSVFKDKKDIFQSAKNFRELMEDVLSKKIVKPKKVDYEKASWPYYSADTNGYNRAVEEILKLMKD